ncbi:MAG: sulfite dehydrogenase, partial [Burkholderiaceae bacterium]
MKKVSVGSPASAAQSRQQALIAQEERFLDVERQNPQSPYYRESTGPTQQQRRRFMVGAMAAIGATSLPSVTLGAPPGAVERPVPPDATKVQGVGIGIDGGYGSRSQFETEVRWRYPTKTTESSWSMTPLEKGFGIITPS